MAAPATTTEFLELIRKSGVLDDKRLDAHVARLRAAGTLPSEPGKLAGLLVQGGLLTHFQAEQILQGKWRRFTIGKYKVLERLGSGGMGSVYLCEHTLMRRRVAVKVLPTAKAADESALQRFYREARAAAALDHANIVHAYDIDQDEALHFLVMEYVDGASLQEVVKRGGPLSPGRAAHYIRQAALGLEHAHRAGLVHRDIKPGNLLLDRGGTVKILDMGLARFFNDEDDVLTRKFEESVLGTADYLAPEQAVDSHTVDIRADIYSLGATLYFCLTGKTPFEGGTVAQKLIWHQTRQAKPVTTFRADVPAGLQAILDRMMAKDREQRYQTPAEVAEALTPWVPATVAPPPEKEMPRLSAAATGVAPAVEATLVTSVSAGTAAPGARGPWQVATPASSRRPPASAAKAPATVPPKPAPVTPAPTPPAPAQPFVPQALELDVRQPQTAAAPVQEEEPAPWEAMAPETGDLLGQADTAPRSSRRAGARRGQAARPAGRRLRWVVLGLGSLAVVLLAVFLVLQFTKKPAADFGPKERGPLLVTREPGHPETFRTIKEALFKARPGDVIELLDERIEENLQVAPSMNRSGKTEVTLTARPGKTIVWTFAKGHAKEPLLRLSGAAGFCLQGEGITLDGKDSLATLVVLYGSCPGLKIKGLELRGFTQTGIEVVNCVGDSDHPVQLLNLRTTTVPKEAPAAAIYFKAGSDSFIKTNDYIQIGGTCVFPNLAHPIQRQDAKSVGKSVKLPERFSW